MGEITTVGIDLAKSVFQVHAVGADGKTVLRRQLRRAQMLAFFSTLAPCLIGMEACAGAHFWARELAKLGHEVRLMPPPYVKPYVKRGSEADQKTVRGTVCPPNDAIDAEAICEGLKPRAQRSIDPGDRLRIPEHPATDSDHIRPPVPTHSATCDALP